MTHPTSNMAGNMPAHLEGSPLRRHIFTLPTQLRYLNTLGLVRHGFFAERTPLPKTGEALCFMGGVVPERPTFAWCEYATTVQVTSRSIVEVTAREDEAEVIADKQNLRAFALLHGFQSWPELTEWVKATHGLPAQCMYLRWQLQQQPQPKLSNTQTINQQKEANHG